MDEKRTRFWMVIINLQNYIMKDYIKLIRWPNLLFLGALNALVYYMVVCPILNIYSIKLDNELWIFILLIISNIFIAAGGYVANDYFDTKIDEINRPTKVIVGKTKTRKQVAVYFQILFGIGIIAGIILSILLKDYTLAFVYITIPGLLWFYSSSYKRQFLIGNIVVGICTFLVIFIIGYAANTALFNQYDELIYQTNIITEIYKWTASIGLFAFLLTLIREIVKDMEDIEGDREMECRTMPIVWGINKSKIVVAVLSTITLLIVAYFTFYKIPFENDPVSIKYFIFGIVLPFVVMFYLLGKAQSRRDFAQISLLLKYIMAVGSLYCVFIYYLILLNTTSICS